MSVILNEIALKALLDTDSGPVGRDIQRRADNMEQVVKARARQIFEGRPGIQGDERVEQRQGADMEITIGFLDGKIESYLATKIEREPDAILPQLDTAFRS
jgi:hypothetical protein